MIWLNHYVAKIEIPNINFILTKIITFINMVFSIILYIDIVQENSFFFAVFVPYAIPLFYKVTYITRAYHKNCKVVFDKSIIFGCITTIILFLSIIK